MSNWIRKGDRVKVIAGNDKGKVGEVLSRSKDRIVVQGVNSRKKHLRRTQQTQGGRVVEMEMPIHASNAVLCDKEGRAIKVKTREKAKGERQLVYKIDGKENVYRSVKKPA